MELLVIVAWLVYILVQEVKKLIKERKNDKNKH